MELNLPNGRKTYIDDEDAELVAGYSWYAHDEGNTAYVYASTYPNGRNSTKTIKLHRLIMGVTDPKVEVDHRDGNGLNNQRSNLRLATSRQNGGNARKASGKTSKYKGVSWHAKGSKWQVHCAKESGTGRTYLGLFADEEQAARAYDREAEKVFGEFARLNFPK